MLPQITEHFFIKPCHQWGSTQANLNGLSLMLTLSSHNQFGRSQRTFLLLGKDNSTEQRREVRSEHTGLDRSNFANTQRAFEGRPNWRETVAKLSVIAQRPARKRNWIKMIDSKFSDDLSPYHFVHTIRTDPLLLFFFYSILFYFILFYFILFIYLFFFFCFVCF